jgi:hypothetical protein
VLADGVERLCSEGSVALLVREAAVYSRLSVACFIALIDVGGGGGGGAF